MQRKMTNFAEYAYNELDTLIDVKVIKFDKHYLNEGITYMWGWGGDKDWSDVEKLIEKGREKGYF